MMMLEERKLMLNTLNEDRATPHCPELGSSKSAQK
jgi:hypothetical protein